MRYSGRYALRAGDGDPCYREADQTVPNWSKAGLHWIEVYYCATSFSA